MEVIGLGSICGFFYVHKRTNSPLSRRPMGRRHGGEFVLLCRISFRDRERR